LVLGLLGSANTKYSLALYSHSLIEGRGEEGEMNGGKGEEGEINGGNGEEGEMNGGKRRGGRDELREGERRKR